jgi:hypothetical protein
LSDPFWTFSITRIAVGVIGPAIIRSLTYLDPRFLCVFVIGVINSDHGRGGSVAKPRVDSQDVVTSLATAFIALCIPLYTFILSRTSFGLKGIRPVLEKAALQSLGVKVLSENFWKKEKKSVFEILVALRNISSQMHCLKLCLKD